MKSLRTLKSRSSLQDMDQKQYLAFDELARRVRDNPERWSKPERPGGWNVFDCTRAPNVYEMKWAFLKWSQHLNDDENYELRRVQDARLDKLERQLDEDPDSLEIKYFNAIGEELRREW